MPIREWMVQETEFDDIQKEIFYATLDKSAIVMGSAGSGKSVLALQKARRIQNEQHQACQIIVYTRALKDYMDEGRRNLHLDNEILTNYNWQYLGKKTCPYLIVDEIQDFSKSEIEKMIKAASVRFFFFGDTAQAVFEKLVPLNVEDIIRIFPEISSTTKVWVLYYNYRLPLPVAKLSQLVVRDPNFDESKYKSPIKQLPYIIRIDDEDNQISKIIEIINNRQLKDVGIFFPTNKQVQRFYEKVRKKGYKWEVKYDIEQESKACDTLNFTTTVAKIMTYHNCKGLQFETVFIPFFKENESVINGFKKPLYVAMTRTCHYLYLFYQGELPPTFAGKDIPYLDKFEEIEDK